jgi:ankyrin repeat protein
MKRERGDCNIALLKACKSGTYEEMCAALDEGASENVIDENGTSALMYVCWLQDDWDIAHSMVSMLLKAGALCNVQNNYGNFALHYAAHYSSAKVVHLLATTWPSAIDVKNNNGCAPMFLCVNRQDTEGPHIIIELYKQKARLEVDALKGETAMHEVCSYGTYDMAAALAICYPESCFMASNDGSTPFMYACRNEEHGIRIMDLLVTFGANVLAMDSNNCTAINYAFQGTPDILRHLSKYISSSTTLFSVPYNEELHDCDPLGFAREGKRYGFKLHKRDFSEDQAPWAYIRARPLRWDSDRTDDVFNVIASSNRIDTWLMAVREFGCYQHYDTGDTLLHMAARTNKLFAVEILMRRRLNPFILNKKSMRAIDEATDPIIIERLLYYHRFKMERAHLDWLGPYFEVSAVLFMWVVKQCTPTLPREVCTLILEHLRRKMYA